MKRWDMRNWTHQEDVDPLWIHMFFMWCETVMEDDIPKFWYLTEK